MRGAAWIAAAGLLVVADAPGTRGAQGPARSLAAFDTGEVWRGPCSIDVTMASEGGASLRVDVPVNDARFIWREMTFPATPDPWRLSFMLHTDTPQNLGRISVMARSGSEKDRDDTIYSLSGLEPGWNRVVVPGRRFFRYWFSHFGWGKLRAFAFRIESNGNGPLTVHLDDLRIEPDSAAADASPEIRRVTVTTPSTGVARVRWTTDVPTTGQVVVGPTTDYGRVVASTARGPAQAHEARLEGLAPGSRLHLRVEARTGTARAASGDVLVRVPAFASNTGGRSFDIGLFGANSIDDLSDAGTSAFDVFQSYQHGSTQHNTDEDVRRYLDRAEALGVKVIAGFPREKTAAKDLASIRERVRRLKSHPALLGWYAYDEPEIAKLPPATLTAIYQTIRAEDPAHPVYIAASVLSAEYPYLSGCDVVLFDRYPVPYSPIESLVAPLEAARRSGKRYGYVFQAFAHDLAERWPTAQAGPARLPSYDEMRTMAWLGPLHGATGLWAFSYNFLHDTPGAEWKWVELTALAEELRALRPALAAGPSPAVRVTSTPVPALEAAAWSDRTAHYVVTANRSRFDVRGEIRLEGTAAAGARRFETGGPVETGDGVIRDVWGPFETHIYRIAR